MRSRRKEGKFSFRFQRIVDRVKAFESCVAFKCRGVAGFRIDHRMNSRFDFALLARHACFGIKSYPISGFIFGFEPRMICLEFFGADFTVDVLFPNVIREAFFFFEVNRVTEALAFIQIVKAIGHDRIDLDERKF